MSEQAMSPMVYGARCLAIEWRIWLRVFTLSRCASPNPFRALAAVSRLIRTHHRWQRLAIRKIVPSRGRYFWSLYAPGFPSRAFDRFVTQQLERIEPAGDGAPSLQTAVFAITKRCSLQCEHCCEWAELNLKETQSAADLLAMVDRLLGHGVVQLFLSGGEPLRRFSDLVHVVERAAPDADVWLMTSGQGLTTKHAADLRAAGLTGVAFSLDHWNPAQHDAFRGVDGSYTSIERGAAIARDAGLLVALSLCPTRAFTSEENLERYAATARQLGAAFVQILEPKAVGRYADTDVALGAGQQRMLEAFADRLNSVPDARALPAVAYPAYAARSAGCSGAGDRYVYVDTDGMLHPCPFCRLPVSEVDTDFDSRLGRLRTTGCPALRAEAAAGR